MQSNIASIPSYFDNYLDQIPKNTLSLATKASLFKAAVLLVIKSPISHVFACSGFSGLACVIYGCISPLFAQFSSSEANINRIAIDFTKKMISALSIKAIEASLGCKFTPHLRIILLMNLVLAVLFTSKKNDQCRGVWV